MLRDAKAANGRPARAATAEAQLHSTPERKICPVAG